MADAALVLMERMMGRSVQIENYANRTYLADHPAAAGPALSDAWQSLTNREFTTLADVALVAKLLKTHPDHSDQVLLRHATGMNLRDFKTGQFIIHGGFRAQPWALLPRAATELWFRYTQDRGPYFFRNARPHPGEQPLYAPKESAGNGETSYARIALTPNLSGAGKVLLVAGVSISGWRSGDRLYVVAVLVTVGEEYFGSKRPARNRAFRTAIGNHGCRWRRPRRADCGFPSLGLSFRPESSWRPGGCLHHPVPYSRDAERPRSPPPGFGIITRRTACRLYVLARRSFLVPLSHSTELLHSAPTHSTAAGLYRQWSKW